MTPKKIVTNLKLLIFTAPLAQKFKSIDTIRRKPPPHVLSSIDKNRFQLKLNRNSVLGILS
jgi:hypothetical protein